MGKWMSGFMGRVIRGLGGEVDMNLKMSLIAGGGF